MNSQNLARTIIVTGSNKGIGYFTVQRLLKENPAFKLIMAVRTQENGETAVKDLVKDIKDAEQRVDIMELDISNSSSIDSFISNLKTKYGQVDALINNAGIASKGDAFDENIVKTTFQTNYYGTVELSEKIKPLIKDHGKIIIVGSMAGKYKQFSDEIRDRFASSSLTKEGLTGLAKEFYDAVVAGNYKEKGWPKSGYGTSKALINTYARLLGNDQDILQRDIQVYVLCPGWCRTDLAGPKAAKSAEEGSDTPVYLVGLPWNVNKDWQGKFFSERKLDSL
jgi:NAD(P)-dependent dehydrogenase (short-subunit alcohol dehydrogenase family)